MTWYNPGTWKKSGSQSKDRTFDEILQLLYSHTTASGENVTPSNAMKCSTVHAIVRAVSNAIGTYPVEVKRETVQSDGKRVVELLADHPMQAVLNRPNPRTTSTMYFRRVTRDLLLWGNHFSLKAQPRSGEVRFLRPIPPASITVRAPEDDLNPNFLVSMDGDQKSLNWQQVIHVTGGISGDGVMAESPVRLAANAIGLALAAERLLAELYGNSGIPGIVLKHPGNFANKEQYEIWREAWAKNYGSGADRGGVGILPNGMEVQELSFKPVDQQVLEMRQFQRTEIASVYGVPPHKIQDLLRATFSNIESQALEFVQDVALPYVKLIEEALERDLLSETERQDGTIIRFDLGAASRGDFATRVDGYSKLREIGAITANEIRAKEGLNPRDDAGGDAFLEPMNMRSTADVGGGETETSDEQAEDVDLEGVNS